MKTRTGPLILCIVFGVAGGPLAVGAQSTVQVGVFQGALPPGATVGALQGALPPGATVGALQGALPPGATVGAFQGALPPSVTVGALQGALPPNTRFGELQPVEVAEGMEFLARMHLIDADYARAESVLKGSITIREQALGPDHPEVAQALERDAALLRTRNRDAAATEMEARAEGIRSRTDQPAERDPGLAEVLGLGTLRSWQRPSAP